MCLVPGCKEVPSKALCRQHATDLERELPETMEMEAAAKLLGYQVTTIYSKLSNCEIIPVRDRDSRISYPYKVSRSELVRFISNRVRGMSPRAIASFNLSIQQWMPLLSKNKVVVPPLANVSRTAQPPTLVERKDVKIEVKETVDLSKLASTSEPLYAIELLAQVLREHDSLEITTLEYRAGTSLRFTGSIKKQEPVSTP